MNSSSLNRNEISVTHLLSMTFRLICLSIHTWIVNHHLSKIMCLVLHMYNIGSRFECSVHAFRIYKIIHSYCVISALQSISNGRWKLEFHETIWHTKIICSDTYRNPTSTPTSLSLSCKYTYKFWQSVKQSKNSQTTQKRTSFFRKKLFNLIKFNIVYINAISHCCTTLRSHPHKMMNCKSF